MTTNRRGRASKRGLHRLDVVTDHSIFDTAPVVNALAVRLAASPDEIWDSLNSDASIADWGVRGCEVLWTSPRPFGAGTTRDLLIANGLVVMKEVIFRWDEGRGYSFYHSHLSFGGFRRWAESVSLNPIEGGTRFVYTVALDPNPALRPIMKALNPIVRASLKTIPRAAQQRFGKLR